MSESQTRGKPRATLALLVMVFLAPVVLAWWLHAGIQWRPTATVNHGVLVVPPRRQDTAYPLVPLAGGGGRWRRSTCRENGPW